MTGEGKPIPNHSALVIPVLVAVLILGAATGRGEETKETAELSGATLYGEACASCHGQDGRGTPEGTAIQVPLPDFTDCSFTTREPVSDWSFVVAHGGAAMGLSAQMPAYDTVLTPEEIHRVIEYIKGFCTEEGWPAGELNFRRPIFTTKAYPENEAVAEQRFTKGPGGNAVWQTKLIVEGRVGRRGQVELNVPFPIDDPSDGPTEGGIGDLAVSYKQVLYASLEHLSIASAQLELVLPSGDRDRGLGDGTVSFEPSLLAGTALLHPIVLQGQLTGLVPVDENRADRGVRFRLASSYPLGSLRRDWWPTLEFEALQNVSADESEFFLTPQIYKAIRKRGHVAVALGVQVPVGGRQPFDYRIVGFLLWEFLDGGLWW
jgi:mono/diheme cytochrome c family protein